VILILRKHFIYSFEHGTGCNSILQKAANFYKLMLVKGEVWFVCQIRNFR